MGRKRTSNKERIAISVDKDLINKLRELEVDRSLLFTTAAKDFLENVDFKTRLEKHKDSELHPFDSHLPRSKNNEK